MMRFTFVLCSAFLVLSCTMHPVAEHVVFGKVWTGNENQPWAEGFAFAGDSIVAVGARSEIEKWIGANTMTAETSAEHLIVPGFIDCHVHLMDGGFALASVQLRDAQTPREFIERIRDFALSQPQGAWILNGDWDHENWGGALPSRDWIDSVTQNSPVWINRLDGHMALANSVALSAAGITNSVKDVKGGSIVRDQKGMLTGIFKDNAMALVASAVPDATDSQKDTALEEAMRYLASHGVTSLHNMSGHIDVFERARQSGKLTTRIYAGMMLSEWKELSLKIQQQGWGDEWLSIGNLKEFVDGSLGSHTAAFFEPYEDTPSDYGFFVNSEETLYRRIKSADSAGLHVMTHAIGDQAIHILLDIYERVARENGNRDRRLRIEHAQHILPDDIRRFAELGVIASMQPYHAIDDGRWAEKLIGHGRATTTYAFRSLLDAGANIAFGSDWFVAPAIPLEGIYAAVTRSTLDGRNPDGWIPEQKISVEEAMKAYTIQASYASYEEGIKGSIEPGKLADFVILDRNLFEVEPAEIRTAKVVQTFVGGRSVYSSE
jgi:predicted amidohydrolase YtcJ